MQIMEIFLNDSLLTHLPLCRINASVIWNSTDRLALNRRQAITWTSADLLLIAPLEANFSAIGIKKQNVSFMKIYLKIS